MTPGHHNISIYQQEASEQLSLVEELILALEASPGDKETLNKLFRVFHTIKGSGAMFGFNAIANFTHLIETLLDAVRQGQCHFSKEIADLTLEAKDAISSMLQARTQPAPTQLERALQERVASLSLEAAPTLCPKASVPDSSEQLSLYKIRLELASDVFARGLDPLFLLQELQQLGPCKTQILLQRVPPLEELNPEQCHLAWNLELHTQAGLNAIRDALIFVEDDSHIVIESNEEAARPQPVSTAPTPEPHAGEPSTPSLSSASNLLDNSIRVASVRLDSLISLVGELVINHSRLRQLNQRAPTPEMEEAIEDLERLVSTLRDQVLQVRMTPIGSIFGRLRRLVRDLGDELGKELELETEGEETELDKSMLDQLADPLMHIIRNAIDHGIETPDARRAAGKAPAGRLWLRARHAGAIVHIDIEDDGRGLDFGRIRATALEKGLVDPTMDATNSELTELLFLPGFSTNSRISTVSGRGVGLDVVRRQVEALKGNVELSSGKNGGTRLSLSIPLTLAIIEGLLTEVAGERYILPLSAVEESLELHSGGESPGNGRRLLTLRNELIPFLRARTIFQLPEQRPAIEMAVILRDADCHFGLVVDKVLGTHQTVVQTLGRFYRNTPHVSGATILGDGQVALILDVAGLLTGFGRADVQKERRET